MKKHYLLLLLLLILPLSSALEIQPIENKTTNELPTTIQANWTGNSTTYHIQLTNQEETIDNTTTNQTTNEWSLETGEYTLTITADNQTQSTTFNIQEETTQEFDITFEELKSTTELQFLITANQLPYSITIEIIHTASDWTSEVSLNTIQQSPKKFDLPVTEINESGTYLASIYYNEELYKQEFFDINLTQPIELDFTHEQATAHTTTEFEAQVSGGEKPYTYNWKFIGPINTSPTSQEQNINVRFLEAGDYQAILEVTDAQGTTKQHTKKINVANESYQADILLQDQNNNLLQGIQTTLTNNQTTKEQTTDETGAAIYENLRRTNYTLTATKNNQTILNTTIEITEDKAELYTIEIEEKTQSTAETQPNATTNQTPQPEEETGPSEEETQEQQLEDTRQQTLAQLDEKKFSFEINNEEDTVLKHLELYELFEQAQQTIQEATDEQTIKQAIDSVPQEITISNHASTQTRHEKETTQALAEEYLQANNILDDSERNKYFYNINKQKNISIQTTSYTATITYETTKEEYTIIEKRITAPQNTHVIEIIPPALAQQASDIHTQTNHEVIRENPIIEFHSTQYMYSVKGAQEGVGETLIVPQSLEEPPLFAGLATINLPTITANNNAIYFLIFGLFVAGLVAGRKINQRQEQQHLFEQFYDLANTAAELSLNGKETHVATITPDVIEIYNELPEHHQEACKEIIQHLKHTTTKQEFLTTVNNAYETIKSNPGDINLVSSTYEQALTEYEQLPTRLQEELQPKIKQLETSLDTKEET